MGREPPAKFQLTFCYIIFNMIRYGGIHVERHFFVKVMKFQIDIWWLLYSLHSISFAIPCRFDHFKGILICPILRYNYSIGISFNKLKFGKRSLIGCWNCLTDNSSRWKGQLWQTWHFQIQNVFKHPFLQQYKESKENTYLTPIETGSEHALNLRSIAAHSFYT